MFVCECVQIRIEVDQTPIMMIIMKRTVLLCGGKQTHQMGNGEKTEKKRDAKHNRTKQKKKLDGSDDMVCLET